MILVMGVVAACVLLSAGALALSAAGVLGGSVPAVPAAPYATLRPATAFSPATAIPATAAPVAPTVLAAATATSVPPTAAPPPTPTTVPPTAMLAIDPTRAPTQIPTLPPTRSAATPTASSGPSCATGSAAITSPTNGQQLKGSVIVRGSASCVDFEYYKFEFVDSRCGSSGLCFAAGKFTRPVTDGVLMTWDTTKTSDGSKLPNGTYVLRLTVVGVGRPGYPNVLPIMPQVTVVINN